MAISYPPIFINDYLSQKIPSALGRERFSAGIMRFFPTAPTDIESLTETFPEASADVFAVYDRMFKMRRKAFPHIKDEQLLYYFYKMQSDPEALIFATQAVQDLLDRGDESAQDLNKWIMDSPDYNPVTGLYKEEFLPVYFHDIKIYQLEETRDIIDFGTARTYAGNKIIIDYCYHTKGYPKGTLIEGSDPARPRYEDASNDSYNDTTI
jgi:hypothetical protein